MNSYSEMMRNTRHLVTWVIHVLRTAPSISEAVREIMQKLGNRLPATKKKIREAKTGYWQNGVKVDSFVRENDESLVSGARYMARVINAYILDECGPGSRVLDVGCGNGLVSLMLARNGCSVTACDVSQFMLQQLRARCGDLNITICHADAYCLPFSTGQFDRVVSRMFLYHFADWPTILAEMARCCRSGGRLLIHITSKENADIARRECKVSFTMGDLPERGKFGRDSMQFGEFDARSISAAARRCGLRVVERVPCMFFHSNPLINFSIGAERSDSYRNQLQNWLSKPDVLAFAK